MWLLLALTAFGAGFRATEYNHRNSSVIDVGYSGVIGAQRIVNGEWPYGHMPVEDDLKACGPSDANGETRERIQTNGRCESANPRGDTYGPVAYESYIPAYLALGWSGKWDSLPAAHATTIAFDLICILGLALVGLRFGGPLLAATLAFAWTAYPFTQYASSANTNDSLLPAFLIWGFWLVSSPWARGIFSALAGWTKFAALLVAPMWITYRMTREQIVRAAAGFALATLAAFSIILLEPNLGHAIRVFCGADGLVADQPRVAVLDLGLAPVPRARAARPAHPAALPRGVARRRGLRFRVRAEAQDAAAARRSDRCAAARLPARVDTLVLSLHPVVLPLRRVRDPGAGGARAARRAS